MSVMQLTEYLLLKSLKSKIVPESLEPDIKKEILQNKKEIFENDMICRVCTNPAEVPITDKIDNTLIMSAIRSVANVSINEADYFPKYVCKICLDELKIAFQFKRKCEASDMMFRKAIPSETTLETNSQPMVKHDFSLILHQMKQKRLLSQSLTVKINEDDDDFHDTILGSSSKCMESSQNDKNFFLPIKRETQSPSEDIIEPHDYDVFDCSDIVKKDVSIKTKKKLFKLHKCKRCDLKFNTKEESEKHRKDKSCIYHPCPECGKLVLNLANHEKTMHSRPNKYTCHQCGKIYYSSGALRNHMHTHKETKEYFCEHCPYSGKRKSYLVCHMRVHTGEHRYLCSECPLRFTNPSNLRKHQLIHYNKKFECSKCKKMFRQKKHLKEHFDSAHLNIRYRCSICGRDLISRKKLLTHELRVHKREKHKLFEEEVQRIVVGNDNE